MKKAEMLLDLKNDSYWILGRYIILQRTTCGHYSLLLTIEKCEPEIALAWAISAKNALQNNLGYSLNELVVGSNINTPLVLTEQLPAVEATTFNDKNKFKCLLMQ